MIIAIDGPAGSGKSSTAQAVARQMGFRHLDSGAFYRALTYAALQRGIAPAGWDSLSAADLDGFQVAAEPAEEGFAMFVDGFPVGSQIRAPEVTANVSAMARVPAVRNWLMGPLRDAARKADLVADGRDIGTVVFPDADLKVFLVAEPEERARRRLAQMGVDVTEEAVRAEVARIAARDDADATRSAAPLRQADDARVLDTTRLSFAEQVAVIAGWARDLQQRVPG
jgi:CMP/dCMP kinase